MKLEPGKYYRTRDGRKARVYAVDGGGEYPIHGAVFKDGFWTTYQWTLGGCICYGYLEHEDLISEWTEPQTGEVWVNVYDEDGRISVASFKSLKNANIENAQRIACVRVKWTEGQFDA